MEESPTLVISTKRSAWRDDMSVLFDNRIELDELALMILAIIDQFGEFLADSLDVVETRKGEQRRFPQGYSPAEIR